MKDTQILFTTIPILCSVIAVVISLKNYSKDNKKETKEDITDRVKRDTTISTKLDMVIVGNTELKNEIKGINNKFDDITEKVARIEESCKQAHKRLDTLENKIN